MKYRITGVSMVSGKDLLYADVEFLDDFNQVVHRNDFIMQISPTKRVYTGLETDDPPNPLLFLVTPNDVPAEVKANIERYISRIESKQVPADTRDKNILKSQTDVLGLLSATVSLVGQVITPTAVGGAISEL